ncbi:hypothetical protein L6R52_23395 [Myxococcota bacterium]|nr:hypothetical protein [Myxococcota bacterium]
MNFTKIMLTVLASIGLVLALALSASAQTPNRYIPYKGVLERDGAPVTATLSMTFDVWTAQSGGSAVFTETRTVQVTGGNFSLRIGPVPETVFTSTELYLAVEVDGVPLGGRQLIQTSPYALRGQPGLPFKADSFAIAANTGADLVVRSGAASLGDRTLEVVANRLAVTTGGNTASLAATSNGGQPALSLPRVVATDGVVVSSGNVTLTSGGISTPKLGATTVANNVAFGPGGTVAGTFSDTGGTVLLLVSAATLCVGPQSGFVNLQVLVDNTLVAQSQRSCGIESAVSPHPSIFAVLPRATFSTGTPAAPVTRTVTLRFDSPSGNPVTLPQRGSVTAIHLPTP